jgi:hypothetical protein
MIIRDKSLKKDVDVSDKRCPQRPCYWARMDPGVFTQGVGYRHRSNNWLCGNREINGCPQKYCHVYDAEGKLIYAPEDEK